MTEEPAPGVAAAGEDGSPPDDLSYEQARAELTDVVRRLEAGGVPLEDSLRLWERGEALARRCEELLEGARARLEAVAGDGGERANG